MCEPTTVALIVMAGAAVVGGAAQVQAGQYAKAEGEANSKIAEYQARDAQQRGAIAEEEERNRVRAIMAQQRAAFGANNVTTSSGSPLGILADTAQYGELDALTVGNNAAREAFGYRVDSQNLRNRGRQAARQGNMQGASTILAGGSQAYGYWRKTG